MYLRLGIQKNQNFERDNGCFCSAVCTRIAIDAVSFCQSGSNSRDQYVFFLNPQTGLFQGGGEFSLDGTSAKLYSLYETVVQQNDGLLWNTTSEFGLYYGFSIPFALLGVVAVGKNLIKSMKERTYNIQVFIMIQFICAVIFGMFVQVNTNRINFIHISMIILIAAGIEWFIACFKSEMK